MKNWLLGYFFFKGRFFPQEFSPKARTPALECFYFWGNMHMLSNSHHFLTKTVISGQKLTLWGICFRSFFLPRIFAEGTYPRTLVLVLIEAHLTIFQGKPLAKPLANPWQTPNNISRPRENPWQNHWQNPWRTLKGYVFTPPGIYFCSFWKLQF